MITFFAIPKPFVGHEAIIQTNAARSWSRTHPDAEVLLFGNEPGIREAALDLGLTHVPELDRNKNGTPFLNAVFDTAQRMARNEIVCYVNGDIILFPDIIEAVAQVRRQHDRWLLLGRRVNMDVTELIDMDHPDRRAELRRTASEIGDLAPMNCVDHFVFPKGMLLGRIPPFLVGRPFWDNWMVWNARRMGIPVIDATDRVTSVHQNHERSWHIKGSLHAQEGWENYEHIGSGLRLYSIANATHFLRSDGLHKRPGYQFDGARALLGKVWERIIRFDLRSPSARR
ncbi:MAG: hypothetical protein KDB88_09020 [Flavobacteriales bacterium]|nr:hypothetical protein [Flavobacteriales bacterium]